MNSIARLLVVGLITLVAAPVLAGTTGQLSGIVYDESGVPLQGVSVTASSPSQIGAVQLVTTGVDGSFRYLRLAPGYYSVLFEFIGYAPRQLKEVQVRLDRMTGLQVTLRQTSFAGEIEVVETTPVVDPVQTSTGQTFTSEYMTATSTNWLNLITQTAGASQHFRRVLGSTPNDGGYLLDGMDSTNWRQRYPNLAAEYLPFDAIQEVAVHTAGFEAELGQATGAVVNVSTKSGGNLFSGTVDVRYTGNRFETTGEHYDPNEQESEDARLAVTLGGPILRDRLWFFTTYGRNSLKITPTGAPSTRDDQEEIFLGKLTWSASDSWSVIGKYLDFSKVGERQNSDQFTSVEATLTARRMPSIATLETFGVLSPSVLWGLRYGYKKWDQTVLPADGDLETIGHYNRDTFLSYGNYGNLSYGESDQNEVSTDVTWLVDGAGSHELKAGVSLGDPRFKTNWCLNGSGQMCFPGVEGFFFQDVVNTDGANIPYAMQVSKAEGQLESGGEFFVAYLQDAWWLRPNLTAKLGLRWDRVQYDNETGEVADLSKLQPRVGIAWDVFNNGKTMVRASWGRFMHPGNAILAELTNEASHPTEYWLSCSYQGLTDPDLCAAIADEYGLSYRGDPETWDPAGWVLAFAVSSELSQTVDNLRAGYADEWLVGFERELSRRTSVELTYVSKASRDMFDDTCNGNVPEPTEDAECDFYLVANLPGIKFDYEALMLRFESRALDNLHLLASWVISESKGSMDLNTSATGNFDFYPYHFVNRYGYLWDHSLHRLKLNGYWLLPYDFSLAFNGWWQSEFRWTPYDSEVPVPYGEQFVEPRGSGKGGSIHQLDLQVAKGFRVGPTRVVLLGTVINVTDSEDALEACGSVTGCGDYDFGDPTAWLQPRRYQLGIRVEF